MAENCEKNSKLTLSALEDEILLYIKEQGSGEAYNTVGYFSSYISKLPQQHGQNLYVHNKWITFKNQAAKKKIVSMEEAELDSSESASTAIRQFWQSKANFALFFVQTLMEKYGTQAPNYHAHVLYYDVQNKMIIYFNPYCRRPRSLPRLIEELVKQLCSKKQIHGITGRQKHNQNDCVYRVAKFAMNLARRGDLHWDQSDPQLYSISLKH